MKKVYSHQTLEVFVGVTAKWDYEEDTPLQNEVNAILVPYPFKITHGGSQNVYEVKPTKSLRELVAETQAVFKREYALGNADHQPHYLGDYVIECIVVHENSCATIEIGS